jgi:hypothetical protein
MIYVDLARIDAFFHLITSEWQEDDFADMPENNLMYHIREWLEESQNPLDDMFMAQFDFEKYMNW